jgi:trimeric autotransporter adhesin
MHRILLVLSATLALAPALLCQSCPLGWSGGLFPLEGVDQRVWDALEFDDGSGPSIFMAGEFAVAGDVRAARVARYDAAGFHSLGAGIAGGSLAVSVNPGVYALEVFDDGNGPALYAGGNFSQAGGLPAANVARWNGSSWTPLGSGTNGPVLALAVYDDGNGARLYAAGRFTSAGGAAANCIARWNGATWTPLGAGIANSTNPIAVAVTSLAVSTLGGQTTLVAAGTFNTAGTVIAVGVARWNGAVWSALSGSPFASSAYRVVEHDDGTGPVLYVAAGAVHRYDGASWTQMPPLPSFNGISQQLAASLNVTVDTLGPALYVGGQNCIVRLVAGAWVQVGSFMNETFPAVNAVVIYDDGGGPGLYCAGSFSVRGTTAATRVPMENFARYDGSDWQRLAGPGLDAAVHCFAVFDDGQGPALYAGGAFKMIGGTSVNHIARWDGAHWSAVGGGVVNTGGISNSGLVHALAVFDDGSGPALYAGGEFNFAGGVPADNVAKWNGQSWTALASGTSGPVRALEVWDSGTGAALYAGGGFATAGGLAAASIARWDGAAWSALGSGVSGILYGNSANALVLALESYTTPGGASALYVGGGFVAAGGVVANGIARYDGSTWSALGQGIGDLGLGTQCGPLRVQSLTVHDDGQGPRLWAGGAFCAMNGFPAYGNVVWDGVSWISHAFATPGVLVSPVVSMTTFDDGTGPKLYAAVNASAGGSPPPADIARWDGVSWSFVSGGDSGALYGTNALAVFDDAGEPALFAGGAFLHKQSVVSAFVGRYRRLTPQIAAHPQPAIVQEGQPFALSVAATGNGALAHQWRRDGVPIPGATSPAYARAAATFADHGVYDCVVTDACSFATSRTAAVRVETLALSMLQPFGPGSFLLTNSGGTANGAYFTALTFLSDNADFPLGGAFFGLWIDVPSLVSQFESGSAPFIGQLDNGGASFFALPLGTLPPSMSGVTVFGLTAEFTFPPPAVLGISNVASITLF